MVVLCQVVEGDAHLYIVGRIDTESHIAINMFQMFVEKRYFLYSSLIITHQAKSNHGV